MFQHSAMTTSSDTSPYIDLDRFDSTAYLPVLRSWLRDIPVPRGFSESNHLLARAFARDWSVNPAVRIPTNELLFYGEADLRELFGPDYRDALRSRVLNAHKRLAFDEDFFPEHPNLRGMVDKYVVVGLKTRKERNGREFRSVTYPKKVLFRSGVVDEADCVAQPVRTHERAGELVHVRGGLMNGRQASLLANHLNSYRRNARLNEVLTWQVTLGPVPSESPRAWLDALGGQNVFLRKHEGSPTTRALETDARENISVYGCERAAPRHPEQVFSYQRPRHFLPPRYTLSFVHGERPHGVPENEAFHVWRKHPCECASAIADAYKKAGFIDDPESDIDYLSPSPSSDVETQAALLFKEDDTEDGAPPQYWYGMPSSLSYARALDRFEVSRVARELRRLGHRRIRLAILGADGRYDRLGYATSCHMGSIAQIENSLGDMTSSLDGYMAEAELLTPYGPEHDWPEWAKEMWR